jgi:hypothetical protein
MFQVTVQAIQLKKAKILQAILVHACDPSIQEAEAEGTQVRGQLGLTLHSETPSKKKEKIPYKLHQYISKFKEN